MVCDVYWIWLVLCKILLSSKICWAIFSDTQLYEILPWPQFHSATQHTHMLSRLYFCLESMSYQPDCYVVYTGLVGAQSNFAERLNLLGKFPGNQLDTTGPCYAPSFLPQCHNRPITCFICMMPGNLTCFCWYIKCTEQSESTTLKFPTMSCDSGQALATFVISVRHMHPWDVHKEEFCTTPDQTRGGGKCHEARTCPESCSTATVHLVWEFQNCCMHVQGNKAVRQMLLKYNTRRGYVVIRSKRPAAEPV